MKWLRVIVAVLLCTIGVAGCAPASDYTARFLRYETLQDGTQVAVISPLAQSEEQRAMTDLTDLHAQELVLVQDPGRSWDEPQWRPSATVVKRAK